MSGAEPIAGGQVSEEAAAQARKLVGTVVGGRFRIEELVALGGIAAVYRATTLPQGEEVAVKVLHPDAEGLPELILRFQREAVAGKHILHPNVAAVTAIDQLEGGSYFIVQEFIRGETLRALIARGPVEPTRAARIARELAVALNAAHDMHIVHRDVKPLNVMLLDPPPGADEPGQPRVQLIDFGLAKVPMQNLAIADEDGRRSLTQAGVVMGTVAYMAPEAAFGMRAVGKAADLYALGLIFYELLAGRHAFTATEPAALFAQQRNAVPPPIAERAPGVLVPPAIEGVVRRLLEKDPDARYHSARTVIAAIDAALRELERPASIVPARLDVVTDRVKGLSPRTVAVLVAAIFAGAGALVWLLRAVKR